MFDKLQQAFWKALTPDLVPDEVKAVAEPIAGLSAEIVAALGGVDNLKSQQPLALTRVRVTLHDEARVDRQALSVAGVAGVMPLEGGVLHLITGLRA
ncbi:MULTISPECIES: PTS transporter subunit EIIB [Pseudomonas]|jgi:glucose-like phosphotransferase system IIB component|uniref:PTS glucose transporter subunit IIB n=1 Tax=Pseudomonas atacamensis TaxID=2565368 RepID=A0AAQ2DBX8_9PSED|nr:MULTISPECIES: PTS transporter subunit EIIB [Pseudomonas]MDH1260224.1 PTS transporter subunit EIIB [Pseudomonas atacamensis]RRW64981.1 PTS glucose transporter subunit IIB [Pseudomonas fluorescens]THF32138.1 PTS glucose transporter subunit IIB [Pseudomonas atacamensis]